MTTLAEHGKTLDGELNDFKGKLDKLKAEFKSKFVILLIYFLEHFVPLIRVISGYVTVQQTVF